MSIKQVPVRAKISIGSFSVETPYILSFNVNITRGQISTFDAVMKVDGSAISGAITGDLCKIYAGERSPSKLIFQGLVKKAKISPCWDDPKYVMLHIGGEDILSSLQGKKFTRRCRGTKSSWASITGVTREGLKSSKFVYLNDSTMFMDNGQPISSAALTHYRGSEKKQPDTARPSADRSYNNVDFSISNVQSGEGED